MPKNFVYSENFTDDRRSPTKSGMTRKEREDDEEGFRHVRVGEHPLEGCTRIPAGACPEQGRMGEDDEERARMTPGQVRGGPPRQVAPFFSRKGSLFVRKIIYLWLGNLGSMGYG
jgi:hypothetical protein